MKKFITKLVIFAVPIPLYFIACVVINHSIYTSQPIDIGNSEVLILGDSHPEKSLKPSMFESAVNISQPAEQYILTYWKLRKVLETNQPKVVILGFAPQNISAFNDLKFTHKRWAMELFKRSYSIGDFKSLYGQVPVDYFGLMETYWRESGFFPKKDHVHYIGKYTNKSSSDISNCEITIERHFYWEGMEAGVSEISVSYLDSIVSLCNDRNIQLVLSSNPVHKDYYDNIPEVIMDEYGGLLTKYEDSAIVYERTENISYPDSLFLNADHTNEYGAIRYTNELMDYLSERISLD